MTRRGRDQDQRTAKASANPTFTYQPEKVSWKAEGLMPRILLCLLRLVFAHKSIAFFRHTIAPRLVHHTSIKIGVTNGYICLALLKQIWVI
jgi:hypothetical protein